MGTMIQSYRLDEAGYRGAEFRDHPRTLKGANDLLSLTQPRIIEEIHRKYLEAGADVIETTRSTARASRWRTTARPDTISRRAAGIARRAADDFTHVNPEKPRFVAGSMGPTTKTSSISPDVTNPAFRAVTFDELERAFYEQARGLLDGGVDLLLPETFIDTLNIKAALSAIQRLFRERATSVPVIASVTIVDESGRNLSGQTPEAFWISVSHASLFGVGINCALGAGAMRPYVEDLATVSNVFVSCVPNAGLPNAFGGYDDTPEYMAEVLSGFARDGFLNFAGGCCGTTPEHVRAIAEAVAPLAPHRPSSPPRFTRLSASASHHPSGLELHPGGGADQRHRLEEVRAPGEGGSIRAGSRGRARSGRRGRQHPRRQHGRRPPRFRAGDDDVPEPRRHRARHRAPSDHGGLLQVLGDRGGLEVPPGERRRQLHQPEGR
jgi:5-methyltetrahydrofolate--homocysteine methyltransferase